MIEKCRFGSMTIEGRRFGSDLMIFPNGDIRADWRRAAGHRLCMADIEELVAAQPQILVVGNGIFGRMKPEQDLEQLLNQRGIRMLMARTKAAAQLYNETRRTQPMVAACFHLTC